MSDLRVQVSGKAERGQADWPVTTFVAITHSSMDVSRSMSLLARGPFMKTSRLGKPLPQCGAAEYQAR